MEIVGMIVVGLVTAGILWAVRYVRARSKQVRLSIDLDIPVARLDARYEFCVLHVRNHGFEAPLNQVHHFSRSADGTKLSVRVNVPAHLGFEYKCFVDHHGVPFSKAFQFLKDLGLDPDSHPGDGRPDRLWFLIPGEPTVRTEEGFINNRRYPE